MSEGNHDVFHLGINREDLEGAEIALIPGDPGRVPKIAEYLENPKKLAFTREYQSYLGTSNGTPVVVMSTGIGGPSAAIAVEELALLGVKRFLRIGTTGAIQPHIEPGDVIITTAAVRMDGTSRHIAPIEFPAAANFHMVRRLVGAAEKLGQRYHLGVSASSDTFYQGQGRQDSFRKGFVHRELRNKIEEMQNLNVLSFEMEAGTVLTQTAAYGLAGACISGVLVNRTRAEFPDAAVIGDVVQNTIKVAVESLTIA